MSQRIHRGWYKHGKLPHFDHAGLYQSITCRLNDSLPQSMLASLEQSLRAETRAKTELEKERRKRIEALLDAGYGSCVLQHPHNAHLVLNAWRHFDGQAYDLIIGVVMPNHVHVLVRVYQGTRLGELLNSWKSFTSRRFEAESKGGRLPHWQRGYWDRFMRSEAHYRYTVRYIAWNPVTAGLVRHPREWPYLLVGDGVALEGDPPEELPGSDAR